MAGLPWQASEWETRNSWTCVKRSNTRCVLSGEWAPPDGGLPITVYAKRYRVRHWRKALVSLVYPPKGRREFTVLAAMGARGIPGPRPLIWAVERRGGFPVASYLLTASLGEVGLPLKDFLIAQPPDERRRLIMAAGRFLRAAHDGGFYHDDCNAEHLFLDVSAWRALPRADGASGADGIENAAGSMIFAFLDVDNARVGTQPLGEARRLKNLVQLWRSFGKREEILTHEMKEACWKIYWKAAPKSGGENAGGVAGGAEDDARRRARLNRIARRKLGREIL